MAVKVVDATGLKCPQPILKVTIAMPEMHAGDVLEAKADCDSFEEDIRKWCERMNKTLLAITRDGDRVTAQIQF
jgi:tRNA 2-thiouridine synthesizing protein A